MGGAAEDRVHLVWDADVLLADGGVVHLRQVRSTDRDSLRAMYARLSRSSVEFRFFEASTRLLERDIERVLVSDGRNRVALVATLRSEVIGVSYFSRAPGADVAEVAFLVEDAHQCRGLGSVVLEHLAAVGRELGLVAFTAEIRPDNRAMIAVFREVGFAVEAAFDGGAVRLRIDLTPTTRSRGVQQAREHRAEARSVARMLTPRTVAVIGASRRAGTTGHEVFRSVLRASFVGATFPVNPSASHVAGVLAYPRVTDVPGDVDLAIIATPAEEIESVVADCATKNVHALIVLSGGFAETGEDGAERERALVAQVRSHGMRLVGPGCMGIMNTDPAVSLNGTLVPTLPRRGRVGFFAQSGALSADVLSRAVARGIGVSVMLSAGNRADVSGNDLLQYWLDDDTTDVVLLYLETFGNPGKSARLGRALSRLKPVIAVQTASAHDRARSEALFRQAGVIRVDTLAELLDVATLVLRSPLPAGNRVAIVGNMMSLGNIAAAACAEYDLQVVGDRALDLGPAATVEDLSAAMNGLVADPDVDAVIAAFIPPLHDPALAVRAAEEAAAGAGKPTLIISSGLASATLPTYSSPEEAVRALGHLVKYATWRSRPAGRVPFLVDVDPPRAASVILAVQAQDRAVPTPETADLLSAYGIRSATDPEPDEVRVEVALSDDRQFGPAISVGLVGIPTTLFDDRSWRALPVTDLDPGRMLGELRAAPLLDGADGRPAIDRAALEDVLTRVARIGSDLGEVTGLLAVVSCGTARAVVMEGRITLARSTTDVPRRLDPAATTL